VAKWSRSEVDVTALSDVVARHGVTRTVFAEADGQPWQKVPDAGAAVPPPQVAAWGKAGMLADQKSGPA